MNNIDLDYIKKLVVKEQKTDKLYELNFKPGVNIVIGPKGGGKSSLLKILHCLHKKYKLDGKGNKNLFNVFENHGYEIIKLIYNSNKEVHKNSLNTISNNDVDISDIITQDSEIKTSIDKTEEIIKAKVNFLTAQISNKIESVNLIFSKYIDTYSELNDLRVIISVDWGLIKFINSNQSNSLKTNLLDIFRKYSLSYKDEYRQQLNSFTQYNDLKKFLNNYDKKLNSADAIKQELNDFLVQNNTLTIDEYHELINSFYLTKLEQSNSKISYFSAIESIRLFLDKNISSSTNKSDNNHAFKKTSLDWVKNLAISLADNAIYFKKLTNNDISMYINASEYNEKFGIEFKIDKDIKLIDVDDAYNGENKVFELLRNVLYSPKNNKDLSLWMNWVEASYTKGKTLKWDLNKLNGKLISEFYNIAENYVILDANGQNYTTMSLGTRTSFGLKQHIKNNKTNYLFLDQPEDNLDNFTIFKEIVPILNGNDGVINKKINQLFVVTHNANIGVLTNTSQITICDLTTDDFAKSYQQKDCIKDEIQILYNKETRNEAPILHYLEGSEESLDQRYYTFVEKKGK